MLQEMGLIEAAQNGHAEVCRQLLTDGANVNQEAYAGNTALTEAAQNGHAEVCEILLNAGASVDYAIGYVSTALMLAAQEGHLEVCQLLVGHGANVNYVNDFGNTALMEAANWGHTNVCRQLLADGAYVNQINSFGNTILTTAASQGHDETAKFLLLNGANRNVLPEKSELLGWIGKVDGKEFTSVEKADEFVAKQNVIRTTKDIDGTKRGGNPYELGGLTALSLFSVKASKDLLFLGVKATKKEKTQNEGGNFIDGNGYQILPLEMADKVFSDEMLKTLTSKQPS